MARPRSLKVIGRFSTVCAKSNHMPVDLRHRETLYRRSFRNFDFYSLREWRALRSLLNLSCGD
jgi:hypothetical protein